MSNLITSIQIKRETWDKLNKRRKLGETFDVLINRILLEEPPIKTKTKK